MQNQIIGGRRENVKLREVGGEDPWAESPMFAPTLDPASITSEFIKPWEKDVVLAGIFRGLRTANKAKAKQEQRDYAVFETDTGEKFRAYTPGQLRYNLQNNAKVGDYVEVTYLGKQEVEGQPQPLHQFDFKVQEGTMN